MSKNRKKINLMIMQIEIIKMNSYRNRKSIRYWSNLVGYDCSVYYIHMRMCVCVWGVCAVSVGEFMRIYKPALLISSHYRFGILWPKHLPVPYAFDRLQCCPFATHCFLGVASVLCACCCQTNMPEDLI